MEPYFLEKMSRAEKIKHGIDFSTASVIEIGALDKPLTPPDAPHVFYVDHADTPTLREKYRNETSVNTEKIVHVSGVWGRQTLAEAARAAAPVDFIVASHVIEHVPDLVTWLKELDSVLKPGAQVRLVIPDKRYCFDMTRNESTLVDVLSAYAVKARMPQPQQIIDFALHVVSVDCGKVWAGIAQEHSRFYRDQDALDLAHDVVKNGTYHDVHCWVFTPLSFARLMLRLAELKLSVFGCAGFSDTECNTLEFFCFLKKFERTEDAVRSWQQLIEKLEGALPPPISEEDASRALKAEIEQLANRLREAQRQVDEANTQADKANTQADRANARADEVNAQIAAMQSTLSWRVTQPLRLVRRLLR